VFCVITSDRVKKTIFRTIRQENVIDDTPVGGRKMTDTKVSEWAIQKWDLFVNSIFVLVHPWHTAFSTTIIQNYIK
jgi:hypothetical protein